MWFLFIFFGMCAWEWVSKNSRDIALVLPAPSSIAHTLIFRFDRLFFHASITFHEMTASLLIALVATLPLVWAMVTFPSVSSAVGILFIIFQSVPTFCLAPLLVMWFGWNSMTIIIPSSLMMLFPLTVSIYKGLHAPLATYFDYFRLNKATGWQIFTKLQLPFALPYFFAGLRIALTISGIGALVGEWVAGNAGLGVLMIESRQSMDFEMTFAALSMLSVMTIGLYLVGIFFENRCWDMYRAICSVFRAKRATATLVAAGSLFVATSCQHEEKPEAKTGVVNLMLDWMPNPDHVPLYVGQKLAFFADENIELNLVKPTSCDPLQPLATKQMDLVISYFPRTITACVKGVGVKIIGKLIQEPLDCIVVLEEGTIKNPCDLSGRTIGFSDSHFTSAYLDMILAEQTNSPIKKQNVNFDLVTALATKQVDAIYGAAWNVEPEQLATMGFRTRFFVVSEFGVPPYDELIFVARAGSKCGDADFIERFDRAMQKSIDYCLEHPQDAFEIYMAQNPDKGPKTRIWEERAWRRTLSVLARSQQFSEKRVKDFIAWSLAKGLITQEPEIEHTIAALK
jgi:NitT/TauT family transport system substrate-binding protein